MRFCGRGCIIQLIHRESGRKRGSPCESLDLCGARQVCAAGEAQALSARPGRRHCSGDAELHLHQRPAHQARERAPGRSRRHCGPRDGGRCGAGWQPGALCPPGRPGDGECGDLLRPVLFLQARLRQQLHRPQRGLGPGLPHRRRAGGICAGGPMPTRG